MATPVRKVLFPRIGDASVVQIVNSTITLPNKNEVQVKNLYAGFAGADINMRNGNYPMQRKHPLTPGYCFVGTVSANGPGCQKFKVGDVVACCSIYDAESTYINMAERYLIRVPEGVSARDATSLVLDWNTAFGMVKVAQKHLAKVQKKRVFVHGMSGAVGHALTVFCKSMLGDDVQVYGTASARNHEDIRRLGVVPFVYTDKKWMDEMMRLGGAHVVFDPLGFESWDESYSILCGMEKSLLIGYGGNLSVSPRPFLNNASQLTRFFRCYQATTPPAPCSTRPSNSSRTI
jgi:synaptic vesicle membrane protein VAT-1